MLAVAALASGCGIAMRWGYDHGAWLAYRWVDAFVVFDEAQGKRARAGLDGFFAWHRRTQLDDYVRLLARARADVVTDTTPAQVCAWNDRLRARIAPMVEQALPVVVDVALTLTPAQIANVEAKNRERNEEWRKDFLQPQPDKRRAAAVDRAIGRTEELYGRLDPQQREWMTRQLDASPVVAETAYAHRLARQAEIVATLRRVREPGLARADAEAQIRQLVKRLQGSEDAAYDERVGAWNCEVAAAVHNRMSPAQRRHAVRTLRKWEEDLKILAAPPAPVLDNGNGNGG